MWRPEYNMYIGHVEPWIQYIGDVEPWIQYIGDVVPWIQYLGDVVPWIQYIGDVAPRIVLHLMRSGHFLKHFDPVIFHLTGLNLSFKKLPTN